MACAEPRLTALKVAHKGEIHRLRVDLSAFHYDDLASLFAQTFSLSPGSFVVQYVDTEGDVLNVTSQAEYIEACSVFLSSADAVKALRFNAVSRTQVAFQENVAEPILKAIEKLVQTLTAAMEKVKQEQWAQRAQTGVGNTGEALNRAAKDARESLYAAGKSIQEIPFDQVLKDTSDGLKTAAEGISSFAHELVDEIKKLQVSLAPQTPYPGEQNVEVEEPSVEFPQPVVASEPEWEQVDEHAGAVEVAAPIIAVPLEEAPVVVVSEPEVVEVVVPAVSAAELKWAVEISMINDILPGVDVTRVIDHLEQCNGNIEVVVNALMG